MATACISCDVVKVTAQELSQAGNVGEVLESGRDCGDINCYVEGPFHDPWSNLIRYRVSNCLFDMVSRIKALVAG
jgi:hypothetical protein